MANAGFFDRLPVVDVQTDACSHGVWEYFRGDWVYSYLPVDFPSISGLHINYKELFSILGRSALGPKLGQPACHHP